MRYAMISDVSAFQTVPLACQTFAIGIYNLLLPTEFSYVGRRNAYLLVKLLASWDRHLLCRH